MYPTQMIKYVFTDEADINVTQKLNFHANTLELNWPGATIQNKMINSMVNHANINLKGADVHL